MQQSNKNKKAPDTMTFTAAYTLALLVADKQRGLTMKALESPVKGIEPKKAVI